MLLQRSRLAALRPERPRLAPPWLIAPLGLLVVGALVALYPHGDLVRRVLQAPAGTLTAAYLDSLLRTDPDNPQLRLELAESLLAAGRYGPIAATLEPALRHPQAEIRRRAEWLLWQADWQQCRAQPVAAAERRQLVASLRQRLQGLADGPWTRDELVALARHALQIGDSDLGLRLFRRLPGDIDSHWAADLGDEALAQGDYRASAELYLLAAAHAVGRDAERRFFLSGLRSLVAGNRPDEALTAGEHYLRQHPALGEDQEVLVALVEYARAARRPEIADRYVRRLLRLSLLEQFHRQQFALTHWGATLRPVDSRPRPGDEPGLPFDDRIYSLGYAVFLDNRKPEDAWKVAASAVRQAPDNPVWRERLAQVSEWTARPRQALDHWLWLARSGHRPQAWDAVLRLAPGLFDDVALRDALLHELPAHPGDAQRIRELAAIYERLGDPRGARVFLERQHAMLQQAWLLALLAEVAEHGGDDAAAIAYWQAFLASGPYPATTALRVALLLSLQNRPAEALQVLAGAADADAAKADYWRLRGELARQQNDAAHADSAYRKLVLLNDAEENDFTVLNALLQDANPREAAHVAATAWRRFGSEAQLLRALSGYLNLGALPESGRLLAEIPPPALTSLLPQPAFLRLRGLYLSKSGRIDDARRDYESALLLAPEDSDTASAWFWLLIDNADGTTLRRALEKTEARWHADPAWHDALAAAWLKLSRPDIALQRYLQPHVGERRSDFLWLMNYADALEQTGEADRAWRLRQHLLRDLLPRTALSPQQRDQVRSAARARLIVTQQGGDAGLAALRTLLRLDRRQDDRSAPADNGADLVALAWLQNSGEITAARGWLWQRFAAQSGRPLWAEIGTALAADDRATAGALLDRYGEVLPRYDRIAAARLVGDLRLAQSDAFNTQSDQPSDDALHLQLTEAMLEHGDHAGFAVERQRIGEMDESSQNVHWHLALAPNLSLDLALGSLQRRNRDASQIGLTPDEHFRSARLNWRQIDGSETRLAIESRQSFERYQPLRLEHTARIDNRLGLRFALGHQLPANDTTALRVAGQRDLRSLGADYQLTRQDTLGGEFASERFQAQTGTAVGNGRQWQFEWRHTLRSETPDLDAGAFWSLHRYRRLADINDRALLPLLPAEFDPAAGTDSFFLPANFRYYGLRISSNMRYLNEYTRRWQPYFSLARTWNSGAGNGYELFAGVAGSLLGNDHLRLGWSLGKGGPGAGNQTRQIGLDYRLHY